MNVLEIDFLKDLFIFIFIYMCWFLCMPGVDAWFRQRLEHMKFSEIRVRDYFGTTTWVLVIKLMSLQVPRKLFL